MECSCWWVVNIIGGKLEEMIGVFGLPTGGSEAVVTLKSVFGAPKC